MNKASSSSPGAIRTSVSSHLDDGYELNLMDCELETLRRAAGVRLLEFDPKRRRYTRGELKTFGLVREGYTREELRGLGVGLGAVSCFDPIARDAESSMQVDTPFGSGIRKWQLPFDMMPLRVMKTVFPPSTRVSPHVHPAGSAEDPGGGLRIVTKGRVSYNGNDYGPGDWFYIPNGVPYSFTTDPAGETECFYTYGFFAWTEGNRFSHPHAAK